MKKGKMVLLLVVAVLLTGGCGSQNAVNVQPEEQEVEVETAESEEEPEKSAETSTETATSEEPEEPVNKEIVKRSDKEYYVEVDFDSESLKGNLYGTDTNQVIAVYLPPSYYDSEKNYPVVYYLHGFGDSGRGFVRKRVEEIDQSFANGSKEFILVGVNASTPAGGAFYVNSPVSGNWEDCVTKEVVSLVDETFRTIKDRDSRGIFGFSMGGFGAINLALRNPDIYGAMLTMSPGIFEDGGFPEVFETWKGDMGVIKTYAQAFSPNPEDKEMLGNVPQFDNTPEDEAIINDWLDGYGNLGQKVKAYKELNKPLAAIRILYGTSDSYAWIPKGCEFLAKELEANDIEFTIESGKYGHSIPRETMTKEVIPFFNEYLKYE